MPSSEFTYQRGDKNQLGFLFCLELQKQTYQDSSSFYCYLNSNYLKQYKEYEKGDQGKNQGGMAEQEIHFPLDCGEL